MNDSIDFNTTDIHLATAAKPKFFFNPITQNIRFSADGREVLCDITIYHRGREHLESMRDSMRATADAIDAALSTSEVKS